MNVTVLASAAHADWNFKGILEFPCAAFAKRLH
jgi:hypothetical protein